MAWTLEKESANSLPFQRSKAPVWISLSAAFVAFVLFLFNGWSVGANFIGALPNGQAYETTRFEFRFGHCTRVVRDPYNQMQWIIGNLPNSIEVIEGTRIVVYDSPGAIIKSPADSMEVSADTMKYHGYMGIWSDGAAFIVDSEGFVQPDEGYNDK